jgi:hypothetical protein
MYKVGQILYTVLEDKFKVIPLKVSEQIITKTLEGETINYKVIIPGKKKSKVDLSKVNNVWDNQDKLREHLVSNAQNAVRDMLQETNRVIDRYFPEDNGVCKEESSGDIINGDQNKEENSLFVDLGDGQKAKLNVDNLTEVLETSLEEDQKKT